MFFDNWWFSAEKETKLNHEMHLKNLRLGFLVIFLCIYSNIAGVGASLEAVTGCKEIEIIHRLFLVIVMYCQASSMTH